MNILIKTSTFNYGLKLHFKQIYMHEQYLGQFDKSEGQLTFRDLK